MAREVCKQIINNGVAALAASLENSLITPGIYEGRIPEGKRLELIQRMADIDRAAYSGGRVPAGGLCGILVELQSIGLVDADVWAIYARPVA